MCPFLVRDVELRRGVRTPRRRTDEASGEREREERESTKERVRKRETKERIEIFTREEIDKLL
jgi:hypothetical protein